ncbi:geranylgeranyl pyrophosphate synthase, chloroplastic/chromoplastic-like [Tripterygium wilfordii]|uniref:geranylgeranyl pyrophosphate synthase, chloroplastic/chromoplastic-like n=1 Tax=Tripterygium wilfordii TaxID=458696 RepID=UPI0018F837A2|nr:geranylgeranyl pyrophosphate synthase, chloroplastic/chromoplastic-like [Tripterygium wilfordii]
MASFFLKNLTRSLKNPLRMNSFGQLAGFQLMQSALVRSLSTKSEDHALNLLQFKEYAASKVKIVNRALDEAIPLQHPIGIHESMRYTLLGGGKRVCSIACMASCELVGGEESSVIPVACAAEMLHDMAIIHDDLPCMDDGENRRGKNTNHKVFGEATALLAGDALLSLAFEHIATNTTNVSPRLVLHAIAVLSSAFGSKGLMAGQFLDIQSEGKDLNLEELRFLHAHKTAKLFEASAVCGAIMGGGSEIDIKKVGNYGRLAGLAFQVVDDIFDVTKSAEELGKDVGKDSVGEKATYPKLMGLENASKYASELVTQATDELAHFDAVLAAPLYQLALYIVNRPR